ncbi:MAG: hypothetical protein U5N86_06880 [Planctomycetota bacterium]|nr:hypothetical protein [Planctomycetota bacterium]
MRSIIVSAILGVLLATVLPFYARANYFKELEQSRPKPLQITSEVSAAESVANYNLVLDSNLLLEDRLFFGVRDARNFMSLSYSGDKINVGQHSGWFLRRGCLGRFARTGDSGHDSWRKLRSARRRWYEGVLS